MAKTRKQGLSHQVLIRSIRSVNSQGGRLSGNIVERLCIAILGVYWGVVV